MAVQTGEVRRGWEQKALAGLSYPANLAFTGVAAFVLALGVVTWLSAAIAAGRALHRWQSDGDDRTFTGTFREFAATWRRTLPASIAATAMATMIALNLIFLGSREAPVAFLFGMATIPLAATLLLVVLMLPAAASADRDATMRVWLRGAVVLAAQRPLASLVLLAIVVAFGLTCVLLPTIVPFLGISLPVWLGLTTARPRSA
ncbi:hypothetical protein G1H11_03210 [Phytoactinopolyspora alkaliphila]|uniref:DUF624 domain-containing protein n=1 Tax=Phytoactinopolyspora alkaliphila TaxID=1783498 RepID=A0A6N9YH68_9ACTN|nr:hypothetical protein [Phytoactinopolyspora alkaliphila]NED94314.1 hypothetical protein [Phytoactinopolyspora alkaliphila]